MAVERWGRNIERLRERCGMCNDVYIAGGGNPMRTPPYPIAPTYKTLTAAAAHNDTKTAQYDTHNSNT